jgi:hypothetical protein
MLTRVGIDHLFTITVDNVSSNDWLILYLKGVYKDSKRVVLNNKFLSYMVSCPYSQPSCEEWTGGAQ